MTTGAVVVFDTNALLTPGQHGVDVFDEVERLVGGYTAVVPPEVAREVESLDVEGAGVARALLERCEVRDAGGASYADDAVVRLSGEAEYVVTSDVELKNRLLKAGVPVIHLRGDNRLELTEP